MLKELIKEIESYKKPPGSRHEREVSFFYALLLLDIKLDSFTKYHVAGTNGKGSTVKFLTTMLASKQRLVGTFISPYVYQFNERIMLNNEPLSNTLMSEGLTQVLTVIKRNGLTFSFFEIMFLTALVVFNRMHVTDIIIETGIGGLYDVTNLINYDYALITNVSYDHQALLGTSLKQIYLNKRGIFKPNSHLITTLNCFCPNLKKYAQTINSPLTLITKKDYRVNKKNFTFTFLNQTYNLGKLPLYEILNIILALKTAMLNFRFTPEEVQTIINTTPLLGCFEYLTPNVIFDGAHNVGAIKSLHRQLKAFNIKEVTLLYALLDGKDYYHNIKLFNKITKDQYYLLFDDERLLLPKTFGRYFKAKVIKLGEVNTLINNNPQKVFLVCGSIHLLGQLKEQLK